MTGFPVAARLRTPAQFKAVLRRGRRIHSPTLTAIALANDCGRARLGLAIAARQVPTAIGRNRIKRQVREGFRQQRDRLPALDLVFMARGGARSASLPQLRASLQRIWDAVGHGDA